MRTKIYTTKKLEKLVKKLIQTDETDETLGILGQWNATVFYVERKKCWLFTNKMTKYNLVLSDIKASDLNNIDNIFKSALHKQLDYDGIITDFKNIDTMIGELDFRPTDNDRSMTGFQNQRLFELDWWRGEFGSLENMPMNDLTNRMNISAVLLGKGRKMSDYTVAIREMKKIITE